MIINRINYSQIKKINVKKYVIINNSKTIKF